MYYTNTQCFSLFQNKIVSFSVAFLCNFNMKCTYLCTFLIRTRRRWLFSFVSVYQKEVTSCSKKLKTSNIPVHQFEFQNICKSHRGGKSDLHLILECTPGLPSTNRIRLKIILWRNKNGSDLWSIFVTDPICI